MIYIDQLVGTGFSFTDPAGLAHTEDQVAENMFEFLQQFFAMFKELSKNDFYLTGESYAGKWIPAIGNRIHKSGSKKSFNFVGVAIGDGYTDPYLQNDFSEQLYQLGNLHYLSTACYFILQFSLICRTGGQERCETVFRSECVVLETDSRKAIR